MQIRKKPIFIALVLLIFIINTSAVFAARNDFPSFGVQPTKIEFDGLSASRQIQEATVVNLTNQPLKVRVLLNDFVFTNNPKHLYLYTEKRLGSSVAPFLSFSPKQFSVPAKGQKKVKVTFLNNGQKLKAGKYSALIFEVEGRMKKGSSTVAIAARIATTVFGLPNVKNMGGQINFFKTSSSLGLADGIFGLKKEPSFIISYKNTGNTHLNVSGEIELKNFLGKRIQTIKFPEYEVYPGLTRDITIPWTKKPIGYFNAKAKVFASLGDKNIKDTSKISKFFYIPYWLILAILAGFAATIFYFRSKRRKRV